MSEAGLQVFNDSHVYQIDGSTPHITLLRKGSAVSTNVLGMYQMTTGLALVPVNPGEILAFTAEGFRAVLWCRYNGLAYIATPEALGVTVNYWIFSRHQPSGLNYGMQVFDSSGSLIYDTGRAMLNVVGTYAGQGRMAFPAARTAVIPWQTYARTQRFIQYTDVGPRPDFMAFIMSYAGCVTTGGDGVDCANILVSGGASGPYRDSSPFPVNWVYDGDNGLDNRFTVIDVANL